MQAETGTSTLCFLSEVPEIGQVGKQEIEDTIIPGIHWKDWCWSSNTLATWCQELTYWKRPWVWERVNAREEGREDEMIGWRDWLNGLEFEQLWEMVENRGGWCPAVHGAAKSWPRLSIWTTIIPGLQKGFHSIWIHSKGCLNLTPIFLNQGLWRMLRPSETDAGGCDRILMDLGLHASTVLLAAQPCPYSVWPSSTFLSTMPLLSPYLQHTRGGCLPRLDRVPPFNQDVHQVFQNHPEGMWAVVQGDSSLSSSFSLSLPLSFSSFLPIYLLTVSSMPDTKTFLIIWV